LTIVIISHKRGIPSKCKSQVEAKKRNNRKGSQVLKYKTVWGEWNNVEVEVKGTFNYRFNGKLKDAV